MKLRLTEVEQVRRPDGPPPKFHPARIFVDMKLAATFWFAMFLLAAGALLADRIVAARRPQDLFTVVDGSETVIRVSFQPFASATNLHLQQAKLAAQAFLNRDPLDFDNPDLLRLMFLTAAHEKARRQFVDDAPEREGKHLHQKAEIARVDLTETRDDRYLAHVSGQLVRTGMFQNRVLTEAVPFRLSLKMLRNPDLTQNGRCPTAVADFKYEIP